MIATRPTRSEFALYAALPAVFMVVAVMVFWAIHSFAGDFHKEFWPAGLRVLHGHSPYVFGRQQIDNGLAFPYPAAAAFLFAPFALLARGPSEVVFTAVCLAALVATLLVLEVRDWRLYGLVLLWPPVVNAWQSANLTLLLAFGIALMWRYRDRPAVAGVCAAAVVSLKPFVWPVGLWLLATRRYRAAAWALAAGLTINLTAFGALGFGEVSHYLSDASKVSGAFWTSAYTPAALALDLGLSRVGAEGIGVAVALCAAIACVVLGRRDDDRRALALAIALMWLATPVLWMHYFALLLVPLAIARPRLEPVWAAPIVLFLCGSRSGSAWQIVLTLAVIGLTIRSVLSETHGSDATAQGPEAAAPDAVRALQAVA